MCFKAMLQQICGTDASVMRSRLAKDHRNQLPAVPRGAGDHVKAAIADEAGLHAIPARVVRQQAVVRVQLQFAYAHFAHRPHVGILRKVAYHGRGELGHITSGCDLLVVRQPIGVGKLRPRHPEPASASITATSLADFMMRACSAVSTVMVAPTGNPTLVGPWLLASFEHSIFVSSVSVPSLMALKVT